jgi:putative acetyltransferase
LQKSEYPTLLDIWKSSIKAIHHFLKDSDRNVLKKIIRENDIFSLADLTCVRDSNNFIAGFRGATEKSLEMLFISPAVIKKGIGKMLLLHAVNNLNIAKG